VKEIDQVYRCAFSRALAKQKTQTKRKEP